jgi:hypothetical protein
MNKFYTVAPKPSVVLCAPPAFRSLELLDVPYSTTAVLSVARLIMAAFSTPRY